MCPHGTSRSRSWTSPGRQPSKQSVGGLRGSLVGSRSFGTQKGQPRPPSRLVRLSPRQDPSAAPQTVPCPPGPVWSPPGWPPPGPHSSPCSTPAGERRDDRHTDPGVPAVDGTPVSPAPDPPSRGATVISPCHSNRPRAFSWDISSSNRSGLQPNFEDSPATLTSASTFTVFDSFSACFWTSWASGRLSMLSIISKRDTASRALLDWRCPMKCHRARPGLAGILILASWTRFSPNRHSPSPTASATVEAGWFLETASNVTSSGERPAASQARSMRCRTATMFSASDMSGVWDGTGVRQATRPSWRVDLGICLAGPPSDPDVLRTLSPP